MTYFQRPRLSPQKHAFANLTFAIASERIAGLQLDARREELWIAEVRYAPDTAKRQIVVTLQGRAGRQHDIMTLARQYRETF